MNASDLETAVKQGMSARDFLRQFRRLMRAKGLKVENLQGAAGKSYLFVHQQALLEELRRSKNKVML